MKYQLIALDLDDTLLDSKKQISQRNREAIKQALRKGAHIVIATGRAYGALTQFQEALGLNDYTIHIGGALIADANGNIVYGDYIPLETARRVMQWAADHKIYFQVYTDRDFRYLHRTARTASYEKAVQYQGVEDPDLFTREMPVSKILLIDESGQIARIRPVIAAAFPELDFKTSQSWFLEISNPSATKGNALKRLGEILGIPRDQTAAFGDSEIDLSMIEYAGLGAVMANAGERIRQAADIIVPRNDDDGVAWGIEKYCLAD